MPTVTGVGLAAPKRSGTSVRVEAEMRRALEQAQALGITDPDELKRRIRAAHRRAKEELGQG